MELAGVEDLRGDLVGDLVVELAGVEDLCVDLVGNLVVELAGVEDLRVNLIRDLVVDSPESKILPALLPTRNLGRSLEWAP